MKFKEHPIQKHVTDYEEAIENYMSHMKKYDEVISIYQIGNVGVPGISDIDIIVFLDDERSCLNNYSVYDNLLEEHKYLFMHDVFIVPKSVGSKLNLITSIFEIKHIYGEEIIFDLFNDEEKQIQSLILLNDIVTVSISHEYRYWLNRKENDLRLIIARVNSLRYPINMVFYLAETVNILIENKQIYCEFLDNFSDFRKAFFEYNKVQAENETLRFLKQAEELSHLLMRDVVLINAKAPYFENSIKICNFNYYNNRISLKNPYNSILVNLYGYIQTDGIISNSIKKNYNYEGEVKFEKSYTELLKQRIIALNECMEFRLKNKISYGGLWPLGYIEKVSLKFRIKRKIKKFLKF